MDNENFGQKQLKELAEDFIMHGHPLKDQWEELLIQLEEEEDFDEMKNVSIRDFWGHNLSKTALTILPDLKKLISNVMSIPIGSADAERAFSVMNHIKHDRRGLLSEKYLEDFLRIWLNGPKKIYKINIANCGLKKDTWGQMILQRLGKKSRLSLSNNDDEPTEIPWWEHHIVTCKQIVWWSSSELFLKFLTSVLSAFSCTFLSQKTPSGPLWSISDLLNWSHDQDFLRNTSHTFFWNFNLYKYRETIVQLHVEHEVCVEQTRSGKTPSKVGWVC